MNRNDYWEVTYFAKRPTRYPDMGKSHKCGSKSEAEIFLAAADLDRVDVLINHYVNGKQVYTRYYK